MNDNHTFEIYRTPTRQEVDAMISEANRMRSDAVSGIYRAIGRAVTGAARSVWNTGSVFLEALGDAREARETYVRLTSMSDRELAAMGISRAEIPQVVSSVFSGPVAAPEATVEAKPAPVKRTRAAKPAQEIRKAA